MDRRPANLTEEESDRLIGLYEKPMKVGEIRDRWTELGFEGNPLSERQLYARKRTHRNRMEGLEADTPVRWTEPNQLLARGVLLEHVPAIRDIQAYKTSIFGKIYPATTYRFAKWTSYVLLVAPEVTEPLDLWVTAGRFSMREKEADAKGVKPDLDDLEALMTFRPWRSPEWESRYSESVEAGLAPKLRAFSKWLSLFMIEEPPPLGPGGNKRRADKPSGIVFTLRESEPPAEELWFLSNLCWMHESEAQLLPSQWSDKPFYAGRKHVPPDSCFVRIPGRRDLEEVEEESGDKS